MLERCFMIGWREPWPRHTGSFAIARSLTLRHGRSTTKLAVPAVLAGGGRYLARGSPIKTYEGGISQRTVLVEFDSLAQAIGAYDSPGYKAALAVLGDTAERDFRIIEGVDD
jgi:uncharacterized protein (DUF1330 family)